MTDKKLLEEFREFIDFMYESIDLEDHQRFIAISESMLKDGWFKWIYKLAKDQAERVQELEGDLETLDSAIFRIGLTINNPNTSDDEKWDEINKLLSEAWERDCIH